MAVVPGDTFKDARKLEKAKQYKKKMISLADKLKDHHVEEKRTLGHSLMDGKMMADLTETLVLKSCDNWQRSYSIFEENLCDRLSESLVANVLDSVEDVPSPILKQLMENTIAKISRHCKMNTKVNHIQERFDEAYKTKLKEEDYIRKVEEEKRKKLEAEKKSEEADRQTREANLREENEKLKREVAETKCGTKNFPVARRSNTIEWLLSWFLKGAYALCGVIKKL